MYFSIGSTTGSNYYVRILSTLDRELLKPSASVALHKHSNALVDVLPPEADSSISMLGADEKPDVSYSDIGGMDMQKQVGTYYWKYIIIGAYLLVEVSKVNEKFSERIKSRAMIQSFSFLLSFIVSLLSVYLSLYHSLCLSFALFLCLFFSLSYFLQLL